MFTANDARAMQVDELDKRIEAAVRDSKEGGAYLRVYCDDNFRYTIKADLEERGFKQVHVPDIILSGDVYFEW